MTKDQEALVEKTLPFARRMARSFAVKTPEHISYDDLFAEASYGLVQAVLRHEPEKNFRSFASVRMYGAIVDYLRRGTGATYSRSTRTKLLDLRSLSEPIGCNGTLELGDVLENTDAAPVDARVLGDDILAQVPKDYERLYRLYHEKGYTQYELGVWMDLSETRVHQLIKLVQNFVSGEVACWRYNHLHLPKDERGLKVVKKRSLAS